MSSPHSGPSGPPAQSSSKALAVSVFLFECDQGDTILVSFPDQKWVLIDCHLPKGRIRDRFFKFLVDKRIDRLDLICLTHPDHDHYHGMAEVIQYFMKPGKSIGFYCDSGVDPKQVLGILRKSKKPEGAVTEYYELHQMLDALINKGAVRYYPANENTMPIPVAPYRDEINIVPIGPNPAICREMIRDSVSSGKLARSVNAISLVFLLRVKTGDVRFNLMLTGDAETDGIERSLRVWIDRKIDEKLLLDAIKIPHHGSVGSFSDSLYSTCADSRTGVAAISVGTKFAAHPDQEVLRSLLTKGWTVLLTTKRTRPRVKHSPLATAGRAPDQTEPPYTLQDVEITWNPTDGAKWGPRQAAVSADDLNLYEKAGAY